MVATRDINGMEHTEDEMDLSIPELKTCPFCGESAKAFVWHSVVTIKCGGCGAAISMEIEKNASQADNILYALKEAQGLWNTEKKRDIWRPIDFSKKKKANG